MVTLLHLRECRDSRKKGSAVMRRFEGHRHESREGKAHRRRRHERSEAPDDTLLFQFAHPLGDRRSGETDALADTGPGFPTIAHEQGEERCIDCIHDDILTFRSYNAILAPQSIVLAGLRRLIAPLPEMGHQTPSGHALAQMRTHADT